MDNREILAGAMRRLRRASGMTLREVTDLTGVSEVKLHRSENGVRPPLSPRTLARVYGVPETEVWKMCPHCGYKPPAGYMCLTCGTKNHDLKGKS